MVFSFNSSFGKEKWPIKHRHHIQSRHSGMLLARLRKTFRLCKASGGLVRLLRNLYGGQDGVAGLNLNQRPKTWIPAN
jgi:hypothetical protein